MDGQYPTVTRRRGVNLRRGTYSNYGEKLDWTYYDTWAIATAGTDYSFFANPIGATQSAAQKTISDTNMVAAAQIPSGQRLIVKAIKVCFISHAVKATADIDTLNEFLRAAVIRFFITGKDSLYTKTLQEIFGASLLMHVVPTVGGNNEIIMHMNKGQGIDVLNRRIVLAEQTNFEVRLSYPAGIPAGLNGDRLWIGLAGRLMRRS